MLDALPGRPALRDRLLDLLGTGTVLQAEPAGDRVFTLEREGDQDQAVIVLRSAVDASVPPRVLVDPEGQVADHAAAIDWFSPSPDGRLLAYGVSEAGSEHGTLRMLDIDAGALLPDALGPVRHPSVAWLPDGTAFAYSRLPDPATVPSGEEGYWERAYWHVVGDDQADDKVLLGDELDRTALPVLTISPDGRWLTLHVHLMPTRTDVFLLDRTTGARTVVVEGEEAWTWGGVVDGWFYATTSLGAPRGRVVRAPVGNPAAAHWTTIVPESSAVIHGVAVAGPSLLVTSTEHAVAHVTRCQRDGSRAISVDLPELGAARVVADPAHEWAFLVVESFARPPSLWRWTPEHGLEPWSRYRSPVDPSAYRVEQVFYPSNDGTPVPMFVVSARTTVASAGTPTVLTGYGGFSIANTPAFSPGTVAWCDRGGVYAVAGIRGGSEYGEDWHRAGMGHRKQQVFDDFAAAADWLVDQGRTSREHLAIRGGSNGGLLVGATVTQRPDVCSAAVCAVPLLDMLRYHRFLIGALWVPEYGDPDDADDFAALHAYSPYHHVERGVEYPALLVMTAESDSRVHPLHARKFVAGIQDAAPPGQITLLRVESRAGHGLGKPRWKQADELADSWSFVEWRIG